VVRNHPFAVLLPDVIVDQYQSNLKKDNLAAMIRRYGETGHSQIMVEPVPAQLVNQYGVVDISGAALQQGENAVIADMVEKPDLDEAPSNFAITGRYVLSPTIWDLLEFTPPGAGDEIQLTDGLHQLRLLETLEAYHIKGKSHDCGNKLGYALANAEYALRSNFGAEFKQKLQQLLAE
jgi:UTP--glucose-1-phosphate uridylyltransferase